MCKFLVYEVRKRIFWSTLYPGYEKHTFQHTKKILRLATTLF